MRRARDRRGLWSLEVFPTVANSLIVFSVLEVFNNGIFARETYSLPVALANIPLLETFNTLNTINEFSIVRVNFQRRLPFFTYLLSNSRLHKQFCENALAACWMRVSSALLHRCFSRFDCASFINSGSSARPCVQRGNRGILRKILQCG